MKPHNHDEPEDSVQPREGHLQQNDAETKELPVESTFPDSRPWWWRALGIRRGKGKRLKYVPTLWGWCLLAGIGLLGITIGFAEYSMQPDFCRSCHLMEPYYQAWHRSTHKNVACTKCHFKPGLGNTLKGKFEASTQAVKFITKTYGSQPHAQVYDASCLRSECHAKRLLKGKVKWKVKNQRGREITIYFDHTPHLSKLKRGKKLRCVSCHSQIVQGQHLVVTLDSCFLCHFKGVKHGRDDQTVGGCQSCHDAPKKEIRVGTGMFSHQTFLKRKARCNDCHADTLSGEGRVPRQVCWNCHNQPTDIARYGETSLIHKSHIDTHKIDCTSCHIQITHHLEAAGPAGIELLTGSHGTRNMAQTGSCGQCHQKTHSGALSMYQGTGGRGVPAMPSPMFTSQVDCIACHQIKEHGRDQAAVKGQTYIAAQSACNRCHEQRYKGVLDNWRQQIRVMVRQQTRTLEQTEQKLAEAKLDDQTQLKLQRLLDDAQFNLRFVKLGQGIHNITYATALMNVVGENCRTINQTLKRLALEHRE